MTTRRQHIAEMRYALAHKCSLAEAKTALTWTRKRAAQELLRELSDRPVISGRELERRRGSTQEPQAGKTAPWMMRD